jgi:hypothetical protein
VRAELRRNVRREYGGRDLTGAHVPRWQAKVGSKYQYSNFGVAILGLLVAEVNAEGLTFADYVARHIFEPLEMTSSAFRPSGRPAALPADLRERMTVGYAAMGDALIPTPHIDSVTTPATGLITSAGDHLKWLLAMLNGGSYRGRRLLEPQSVRLMLTPQVRASEVDPSDERWNGLLVELAQTREGEAYFGEMGAYPWGWWGDSRAFPATGVAVVVLTNTWRMPRWFQPADTSAHGLIADRVATTPLRCACQSQGQFRQDRRPWKWKRSYVIGAILAERCLGLLGVEAARDADDLRRLATLAEGSTGLYGGDVDVDGLVSGAADMLEVEPTPTPIAHFARSGGARIGEADFRLACVELTGRAELPTPMRFYAAR